ncbi:uncharacterized protein LOC142977123 isoform X2 [Anticarsia gemmatalis]|uniref:uncharacterized protein LOC142977123 isoform X2 n=1 Tax=Anticarsia gemmatalis TaxID=129554 RepID=UPI003F757E38
MNLLRNSKTMEDTNSTSLCRICLQNGAKFPIFEKTEKGNSLRKKLTSCLQCAKIEDVDGFPRHICAACNTTLETLCNFINTYKQSCKILENGHKIVKKENVYNDESDTNIVSEVEIEIKGVKVESDDHYDDGFDDIDDEKPLKLLKEVKLEPVVKKEPKCRKTSRKNTSRTNKIASSILEGNFLWNGDKCMKIGQTTLTKVHKTEPKPRPQTKVSVPHIRKIPEQKLCDLCGDVFKNQDKLNTHKRSVHYKKPVQCPKCPRICVSDYYLKRHMKRKHENSRNFICSSCGQAFTFKGELSSHFKNVHNKHLKPKKIYACKLCDKVYKCQKSVLIHERAVHTGQRPAQCCVCGSSFYHEDYLKEHMRLHTGETPFKCPICGRGYAQRGNMKSHLRIHRVSELDAVTLSKLRPNYLKLLKV